MYFVFCILFFSRPPPCQRGKLVHPPYPRQKRGGERAEPSEGTPAEGEFSANGARARGRAVRQGKRAARKQPMAICAGLAVSSLGGHPRAPRAAWKTTITSQRVVLGSMIASGRVARPTGPMFGRLRDLSCFMEPSTECGGGGRLPPPRVLKVSFSGDGDEDQNTGGTGSKRSGDYIPLGYGCFLAMVLLVSKCLV